MTTRQQVIQALSSVRDPELDEPLTDLRFVSEVEIQGCAVEVRLRLPTYFCAPNFAYMMVADARAAVIALDGVERVSVALDDHFASQEISGAVARGDGFAGAFPGETEGGLTHLRDLFARKALLARQSRLSDWLLRAGATLEQLAAMRLEDLEGPDAERCLALRQELGLDTAPRSPAFVLPDGNVPSAGDLARYLRLGRLVKVSVEGNAGLCRALLETRYGIRDHEEIAA
jgi:metal-sulfur cluster biosynthetic enzyme